MFHIQGDSLRVCRTLLQKEENQNLLRNIRLIIIQHLLSDSAELVKYFINAGCKIDHFFAKPYSIDAEAENQLKIIGINISVLSYNKNEYCHQLKNVIKKSIECSRNDDNKLILLDVGGYFADIISELSKEESQFILGIVEDTTFGHTKYSQIQSELIFPVFSVARSKLKEIEAYHVGSAVVTAIEMYLKDVGVSLAGRHALQVGFGMIGKNIAYALKTKNVHISVYDNEDVQNIHAFLSGYEINKKIRLLPKADLIISATGKNSISENDFYILKNNVVLASAGSQNIEFDIKSLNEKAINSEIITNNITKYVLGNMVNIFLLKEGTAVNFGIKSVPDEVMDLVFSEIIMSILKLISNQNNLPYRLIESDTSTLSFISKEWLKLVNF